MATFGWIGLGRLGAPMAAQLLEAGHDLRVCDLDAEKAAALERAGARVAGSAAEAAGGADAVMLCVSDTAAVEQAVFGAAGIAAGAAPGTTVIDHSTTHPRRTADMAARARQEFGIAWVDAPVSGGPPAAKAGALNVWLGGAEDDVARIRPWIAAYAGRVTHMGASGQGQVAKSCNQLVVATTIAAWAEMLDYARSCGVAVKPLIELIEGGGADFAVRRLFADGLAAGDFPDLSRRNMIKDLGIVHDIGEAAGAATPLADMALTRFHSGIVKRS